MYFTNENLTELYCQRQELLVQEARNRRLARRQLRAARRGALGASAAVG